MSFLLPQGPQTRSDGSELQIRKPGRLGDLQTKCLADSPSATRWMETVALGKHCEGSKDPDAEYLFKSGLMQCGAWCSACPLSRPSAPADPVESAVDVRSQSGIFATPFLVAGTSMGNASSTSSRTQKVGGPHLARQVRG